MLPVVKALFKLTDKHNNQIRKVRSALKYFIVIIYTTFSYKMK